MSLQLLLFTNRPTLARRALAGGTAAIVIDWERIGKRERQLGADTLISGDTPEDLARMRASVVGRVICRLDPVGPWTDQQVEIAIGLGADELLVPMVRQLDEVEHVLVLTRGRCGVGILVETLEALASGRALATLPLSRVYVGLTDLAIARRTPSIFTALLDGTVDQLRITYAGVPFGVGGVTVPESGQPIPARLLFGELARIGADFTVLRRSFWGDVVDRDPAEAVVSIRSAAVAAAARDPETAALDHQEFSRAVCALSQATGAAVEVATALAS